MTAAAIQNLVDLLAPTLDPRRVARLHEIVGIVETALKNDFIWNVDFQESKDDINRAMERVVGSLPWDEYYALVHKLRAEGKEAVFGEFSEYDARLSGLKSALKKLNGDIAKLGPLNIFLKSKEILEAAVPVAILFETLKGKIRKGRKVSDTPKDVFTPKFSEASAKIVRDLFDKVTSELRAEYISSLERYFDRKVTRYLEAAATKVGREKSPYVILAKQPYDRELVSKLLVIPDRFNAYEYAKDDTYSAKLTKYATETADEVFDGFKKKNVIKISAIVEKKGNLESAEIIKAFVQGSAIESLMIFKFADGSQFTVQNSTVWSTSSRGLDFTRYPTTFHNVFLPGGVKMPQPSEKRMNEVF